MAIDTMISSDSHIIEPPDLWSARIDRQFAERGPVVRHLDDGDWWFVDGRKSMSFLGFQTGDRFVKDPTELRTSSEFREVRLGAYDPAAFIKENEDDGVIGSVIYPSQGLLAFSIADSALCSATMRAYNDAIAEFCSEDRNRLKGMAMLNIDDPAEAVAELTRCRDLGLAGALITVLPTPDRSYDNPMYEPLWSAAEDLDVPLALHVATGRASLSVDEKQLDVQHVSPTAFFLQDHFVRKSLGEMIFAGVFERHPRLKVGSVEHEVAWIPFFCDQMDYTYTERPVRGEWHRFKDPDARPSHFFRDHVFVSFQEDRLGVKLRHEIGVENLMWGSDYPHTESTFPRSREIATEFLAGVPDDEQRLIVRDNAARLFGFHLN